MNTKIIEKLIDDVDVAVSSNNGHAVWQTCNVLREQIIKVDADNIMPPDVSANFLKARSIICRWATDIRGADLGVWESVFGALKSGIKAYVEPMRNGFSGGFIKGVLGYKFIEQFGEKFAIELLSYYDVDKEGDVIWKREKLMTLWRYFESNRKAIDAINPQFDRIIGMIANRFTVRHENDQQMTDEFLKKHTERDYERLLDYTMSVMLTAFANLNFVSNIEPELNGLLVTLNK